MKYLKTFENIKYISEYTKHIEPLTVGVWRECYENARIEYWKRIELGENVKYCVGTVYGKSRIRWDEFYEMVGGLHHAWVVVDEIISDSTPFKYGIGNTENQPEELATTHFKDAIYKCQYFVDEDKLMDVLKFYPNN